MGVGDWPGDGVVVAVGVLVGTPVGVAVGDPVAVGVGVAIVNVSVHAGATALGSACGTVGATGVVLVNCLLVKNIVTPSPTVTIMRRIKYQYFFMPFILLPRTILEYLSFYRKGIRSSRNYKWNGKFT